MKQDPADAQCIEKRYISAQQLLDDAYQLGLAVLESEFRPDFIVGVWRGGAPVGIAIQELLAYCGIECDHIAIRTSLYTGINQREDKVQVHGLGYLTSRVNADSRVLIVDDVHDTGLSVEQVISDIEKNARCLPQLKVATPYFKPGNNRTGRVPDYYLHSTDQWLVFPHELVGLTPQELLDHKPGIGVLKEKLISLRDKC